MHARFSPSLSPRRIPTRRGFVLLMALLLILLAGLLLVGLARQSLAVSMESQAAGRDLQRRWGTHFLARALLADPEPVIARHWIISERRRRPLPLIESFALGELRFQVMLDDESRKLNVNRLYAIRGVDQVLAALHELCDAGPTVELKPVNVAALGPRRFDSWGHVLALTPGASPAEVLSEIEPAARSLTCWGNGRVNLHRCSEEVLFRLGALAVGPITANQLVAARDDQPQLGLEPLLETLGADRRKVALLKGWLSDTSTCYALWVITNDQHGSLDLLVRENTGTEADQLTRFQW